MRPSVLVVDEVGYQPLERADANMAFQGDLEALREGLDHPDLEQDLQRMGTGVRRRGPPTAILDRLLHHCEVISINGPSYRLKNRLKAIERENDVA
ncbi:ATP-binding protein [Streptomyces naphthomycinicus]|uniref:ATP-binding protein n=1 Tax=Streptomyces naphthomycinicus TaxID=2872625 RepID=UPI001CED80B5|nr:ATP-binding protein [Streptomyces sp. TML10]